MSRVGWLDASNGISGDMLLGALVDVGVPLQVLQSTIDALALPERIVLSTEPVMRSSIGALKVHVGTPESHHHRHLSDILALLEPLDPAVADTAAAVFCRLAEAEGRVHRMSPDDVHFHEVGALDSIADVVGVVTGMQWLGLERLLCSTISVGGGRVRAAHGSLPVPPPAVTELLVQGAVPAQAGPADRELATPTGVALAITLADAFGPMPAFTPDGVGTGAGTWNPDTHPNVVRLLVGSEDMPPGSRDSVVLEANVDDLDPRLWPQVIAALMRAGADDAWLTPILMKKSRLAHTVSVLATADLEPRLARVLLEHSSTIGFRRTRVEKVALPRAFATVEVDGHPVRIKVSRLDGRVVNVSAEYDDVARVAGTTGRPEKVVLAEALAAATPLWSGIDT